MKDGGKRDLKGGRRGIERKKGREGGEGRREGGRKG